jgi:hypothetical protein
VFLGKSKAASEVKDQFCSIDLDEFKRIKTSGYLLNALFLEG